MVYTFTVALDEECRLGRPFLFGQQWCAVDGDVLVENPFHPFYGTLISVLPDLRELLRVVYAEDMVHGDVNHHHKDKLVPFIPDGGKHADGRGTQDHRS